jgi:hypothetical protein
VAELATRLNGESNNSEGSTSTDTEGNERDEGSTGLLNIQWNDIGSVAYDLWMMLAMTVVVIVLGRPVGWLVNQIKQAQRKTSRQAAAS